MRKRTSIFFIIIDFDNINILYIIITIEFIRKGNSMLVKLFGNRQVLTIIKLIKYGVLKKK